MLNPSGQQVTLSGDVEGNPGRTAVLVSAFLAVGTGLAVLFLSKAQMDDQDKAFPPVNGFGGLYLKARTALGGSAKLTKTSMIDAYGAGIVLLALFPAIIAIGAFFVYRQRRARNQSTYWPLTIAMILMALAIMFRASWALPALIAMAIAGFQVRKAEMQAGMTGRVAAGAEADDEYEEDDSGYEDDDEDLEYEDYDDESELPEDDEFDEDEDFEAEDLDEEALDDEDLDEDDVEAEAPKKK